MDAYTESVKGPQDQEQGKVARFCNFYSTKYWKFQLYVAVRQEKSKKAAKLGKNKQNLFVDNMVLYVEN